MTPPKVATKSISAAPSVVIPRGVLLPEELEVKPKETLFGIIQDYRDLAIKKNPSSLLANYTVDALVYAVQVYRETHPILIKNGTRKDPVREENKFRDGLLIQVQEKELLNLKSALTETVLKKLYLILKTEGWEPNEIWVNPKEAKVFESSKPKPVKVSPKLPSPVKPSLPASPGGTPPRPEYRIVPNNAKPIYAGNGAGGLSNRNPSSGIKAKPDPYPWFKPTGALVKHVDIGSLKRVEAWRDEVAAEVRTLSLNKELAPFIPPIDKVLGVIHRESKGRPAERGDLDKETNLYKSFGLAQIQVETAGYFLKNATEEKLLDARTNIRVALRELTEFHKRAAHGDPSKINEFTVNVAIGAHNVGKGWFYRHGFSPARKAKLDRKVGEYLAEVNFVAQHLRYISQDATLLASAASSKKSASSKP